MPGRDRGRVGNAGQTSFDFLVGMSVFLITLGLVFGFVPGVFQPFDTDTGPDMAMADRSASSLVGSLLVENVTRPGVLNATCTAEFFDADGVVEDCRFEADATDVNSALGLDEFTEVNVTIESGGTIQTLDGGTVTLAAGRAPPTTADVVVAKRVVLVEETHLGVFVRVW